MYSGVWQVPSTHATIGHGQGLLGLQFLGEFEQAPFGHLIGFNLVQSVTGGFMHPSWYKHKVLFKAK